MAFRKPLVQLLLFCAAIFLSQSLQAQSNSDVHFASDPAVSPDGETVVFVYENDLWQVPANGGRAVRLTGLRAPTLSRRDCRNRRVYHTTNLSPRHVSAA